ncbi:uncharacterized protein LOC142898514 isoform X2 [Nelusetta ayraudi]|uniref:uncharacterized protein LOC142898514 isoform X2 n=1 Tax=Nelusetta ayraudi TaxID=303726 RepID=UPI003F70EFE4
MDFTVERIQRFDHHGLHCRNKGQRARPRHLHQTTFILGQDAPCYLTSHKQAFSGMSSDGSPHVFRLRDPCYPSQHHNRLDLSDMAAPPHGSLQTHTKEVHGFKATPARTDPMAENWARYRSGRAARELTHPDGPSEMRTSYSLTHTAPVTDQQQQPFGRQTRRHQHNILTGEQRRSGAAPTNTRLTRHKQLWAARRWETDCCTLRLH